MLVLFMGIALSGIVGLWTGSFDIWGWNASMGLGITNMGELIIVTLLAGGMLEMIRYNGGIDWIIRKLTSRIHSSKGAEMSIAALVSFANLCTANNTIALIMAGPIAKDIADRFKIDPRRSASLLDIFSCFVQGIIPYGAQMLMAAGSGMSPLSRSCNIFTTRIYWGQAPYWRSYSIIRGNIHSYRLPVLTKKHNSIQSKKTIVSGIEYYCVR